MSLLDDVRDLIGDFFDGEINAHQFRERFAPMFYQSDEYISEIQDVFIDIDAIYAGYITGRIDEAELRKQLFEFLPSTRIHVPAVNNSAEVWRLPIATHNDYPRFPSRSTSTNRPSSTVNVENRRA